MPKAELTSPQTGSPSQLLCFRLFYRHCSAHPGQKHQESYFIFLFPGHTLPATLISYSVLSLLPLRCSQDFLSTPITATLIQPLVTLLPAFVRAFYLVSLDQAFLSRSLYIGNEKQSSCFNDMYLLLQNFQWLFISQSVTFIPL